MRIWARIRSTNPSCRAATPGPSLLALINPSAWEVDSRKCSWTCHRAIYNASASEI
jgi:hypothetical protein